MTQIAYCYLGDARNNMGDSLLVGGAKLGHGRPAVRAEGLWPDEDLVDDLPRDRRARPARGSR